MQKPKKYADGGLADMFTQSRGFGSGASRPQGFNRPRGFNRPQAANPPHTSGRPQITVPVIESPTRLPSVPPRQLPRVPSQMPPQQLAKLPAAPNPYIKDGVGQAPGPAASVGQPSSSAPSLQDLAKQAVLQPSPQLASAPAPVAATQPAQASDSSLADYLASPELAQLSQQLGSRAAPTYSGPVSDRPAIAYKKGGKVKSSETKKDVKQEVAFMKKAGAPKRMIRHEKAELAAMKSGGRVNVGGKRAHGEHTIQTKGHTRGKVVAMKVGGVVKASATRPRGEHSIQLKGHTKGKVIR